MRRPKPAGSLEIEEVRREDTSDAEAALALIEQSFSRADRHAPENLRSELEEKRRRLVPRNRAHLLVAKDGAEVVGTAYGTYLAAPNCGFVAYLAVHPDHRRKGIAPRLRAALVSRFGADARSTGREELAWIVGEVRRSSKWLTQVVKRRGAIPLDFEYYHPGIDPSGKHQPFVMYLEPIDDARRELPTLLVTRIVFSVYRMVYRIRYPLLHPNFRLMIEALEERETIGPDEDIVARAEKG